MRLIKNLASIVLTMLLLCLAITTCFGQNASTKSTTDAIIDSIKKYLNNKSQTENCVTLSYDPLTPINLYYYDSEIKSDVTINIDSVSMLIKSGVFVDINIFSGKRQFTNQRADIDISSRRFGKSDFLYNIKNHDESIKFQDVISGIFYNSYVPEDGFYWITPSHNSLILAKDVSLNTVFDLRLYTDALGLFGGSPNGLAQTDAIFKKIMNRANIKNSYVTLFNYIKFDFNAQKFDSKNKSIDSAHFSRTALLQKSFLNVEAVSNIFTVGLGHKSLDIAYLDIGAGVGNGLLAKKVDTITVIAPDYFFKGGVSLQPSDNVGAELNVEYINQYSPQTDFQNINKEIQNKQTSFWKFGAEIYWNPFESKAGRVFGKFSYFIANDHDDSQNHFVQLQFGYSILLSSVSKK